jgi:hypothetical protein
MPDSVLRATDPVPFAPCSSKLHVSVSKTKRFVKLASCLMPGVYPQTTTLGKQELPDVVVRLRHKIVATDPR